MQYFYLLRYIVVELCDASLSSTVHTRGDSKVTGIWLRRGERVGKLMVRPGV